MGIAPKNGRPRSIAIEPTNRCNLNCPFCMVGTQNARESTEHDLMERGAGYMDFKLYEKIIGDAADFGIERALLCFQGEPLLYKQFPDMVRVAKSRGLHTQVFTNGLLLTESLAERIVESGLDFMRFSVDGASEETYQQNRVGGKFERVLKNMEMMVRKTNGHGPQLEWQFIVQRNNEHELETAKKTADQIGIGFMAKTLGVTDPERAPQNPLFRRNLQPKPCQDIYRAVYVFWNGDVVPCCYDPEGREIMGNLGKATLEEIWNSKKYVEFRRRVDGAAARPENEPDLCKGCLKWGHGTALKPRQHTTSIPLDEITMPPTDP